MNYESEAFRNDTKLEGRYPNYLNLSQNTFEFVLGASHFYPENQHAQLYTRVVTTPTHAKAISMKRASGLSKRMEEWNRHRES